MCLLAFAKPSSRLARPGRPERSTVSAATRFRGEGSDGMGLARAPGSVCRLLREKPFLRRAFVSCGRREGFAVLSPPLENLPLQEFPCFLFPFSFVGEEKIEENRASPSPALCVTGQRIPQR